MRGTRTGDSVKVWFTGEKKRDKVSSPSFTYTRRERHRREGAGAGQRGLHGRQPHADPARPPLKYAAAHLNAVRAAGYSADLWDVDAQGIPHDLGVLSHYKAIVWYLGDNRFTQDPEDVVVTTPLGNLPDDRGRRAPSSI